MKITTEILCVIVLSMLIYSCKKENKPPVINNIQFNPTEVITNSVVTLTATATDSEGDNLSYTWNCPKGTFTTTTGQSVNWTAPTDAGSYLMTVTVNDGKNTVSQTSNIAVLPAIGSLSVNSTPSGANIFIDGVDTKKLTPSNFNDMTLGKKIISVAKTGYLPIKDTLEVNIQYKKTSTVSFTLVAKANISGYVYYAGTQIPVSGVTVSVQNKTMTTSTTGSYSITEIASGNTILTATKPDYDPFSKSLSLNAGNNSLNIEMTSGIYTNTTSGTIKTSIGTIIPGVTVSLLNEDGSNTNIHDQTDASGKYQLPAVPQGQRKLSLLVNGFISNQKDIFVSNANRTFDVILLAGLITPSNPIQVVGSGSGNKIKWTVNYGPELLGFNIYRASKNSSSNYIKLNSTLLTLASNPPINGYISFDDQSSSILLDYYYKISAVNVDSYEGPLSNYLFIKWGIKLGDNFQGGKVAYFLKPNDPGYIEGEAHGFILASTSPGKAMWGCYSTFFGDTATAIGTGKKNTDAIVKGCSQTGIAAKLCADFISDGYDDWYLPSILEATVLIVNQGLLGITNDVIWSSSEYNAESAWNVWSISQSPNNDKRELHLVRPIRSF